MRAVYVTHNGIGSALVRSQVLPYLRGLAERGIDVDLVTFERGSPSFPEGEFPRDRWHARRARSGSSLFAKLQDILAGVVLVTRLVIQRHASLVHARSYVPAAIARASCLLTRRPYVFDMRGFLGEEYVEGGNWTADDLRYRAITLAERWLLRGAREIVVLTDVAARRLRTEDRYRRFVGSTPVTTIPCAVDLARFVPASTGPDTPTIVYSGSLGMWYALDEMLVLYALARRDLPSLRFLFLNRDEHALIESALRRHGLEGAPIETRGVDFAQMPGALTSAHVGICLLRQASSKSGSSAIKVAEYLACGLPVVVNAGHGDIGEDLVTRYGAGHVLRDYSTAQLELAARETVRLIGDVDARHAARRLAVEQYDVVEGVRRYAELYGRATTRR